MHIKPSIFISYFPLKLEENQEINTEFKYISIVINTIFPVSCCYVRFELFHSNYFIKNICVCLCTLHNCSVPKSDGNSKLLHERLNSYFSFI